MKSTSLGLMLTEDDITAVTKNIIQVWKNDVLGEQRGLRSMSQEIQDPVFHYLVYQMRDTHAASKWLRDYKARSKYRRGRIQQLEHGAFNVRQRFADARVALGGGKSSNPNGPREPHKSPSKGPKFSREGVRRGTVLGNLRYYSEEKQYSAEHIAACRAKAEKIGRVEVGAAILERAVRHAIETVQTTIKFTRDSGRSNTFHNYNYESSSNLSERRMY